MATIGLISPGQMGASIGAAVVHSGARLLWAGDGRSAATHDRAARAGLVDCGSTANLISSCDIILSICPPHDAQRVAASVAAAKFSGLFLEGNAIAPRKTRRIQQQVESQGASVIDGGIVGGPPWQAESGTRLYLSGVRAEEIANLFDGSPLHTSIISDQVGAASAMKMVFAAYTKGSIALLIAILGVAEREGVRATLVEQWGDTFTEQTYRRITTSSAKAWRFVGEMREITATFENAGLPGGFHGSAADVFERLAEFKDAPAPDIEALLAALLKST